jgi:hypothetical protein
MSNEMNQVNIDDILESINQDRLGDFMPILKHFFSLFMAKNFHGLNYHLVWPIFPISPA